MKKVQYMDIMDNRDPIIYAMIMTFLDILSNDGIHEIKPGFLTDLEPDGWQAEMERRLEYGYSDNPKVTEWRKTTKTVEDCIKYFEKWVIECGGDPKETILMKIWW